MVAKVKTFCFAGIEAVEVDVQVKIEAGMPKFNIVGLPDKAVGESKERVRSALVSIGLSWPQQRVTVNLAPADLQKEGSHFDLAIAVGILIEMEILDQEMVDEYFMFGELALDGSITEVGGAIIAAISANQRGYGIICPKSSAAEASWASNPTTIVAPNLIALINHFKGEQLISPVKASDNGAEFEPITYADLKDIKGQSAAKRALEIAAAGGHNLLLVGPPGTGKSMLASRLIGILPAAEAEELLEINMIHSVNGGLNKLISKRPYRDPHHSCSVPAMVGGGMKAKPGEISLAHNGILFLDEFAEFPRQVLDSLRQPLEVGTIMVSRANSHFSYPANFQLVAAMNPCRCGYLGNAVKECKRAPNCGEEYRNKISGPMLDRIDIIINVPAVDIFGSDEHQVSESSAEIKERVVKARALQQERYQQHKLKTNAKAETKAIEKHTELSDSAKKILQHSVKKIGISMRGISRIIRVARTIADLDQSPDLKDEHLLEAISYRRAL